MISTDYIIAGHRIRVEGLRLLFAMEKMRGFNLFAVPIDKDETPIARFIAVDDEAAVIPQESKLLYRDAKDGYQSVFAAKKEGGYLFDSSSEKGERVVFETSADCKEIKFSGDYNEELLRFALWLAYGLAVLPTMTVSLHASSILYDGKVVLFLGESGTGKSTHSRLWLEHIDGAELFNDDSPILRYENGEIRVYGGPWSGKTPCFRNEYFPLGGCVRLSQAPYNKISRLSIPASYAALHPSCPPEFAYDELLYDYVSDFLGKLVECAPVYKMEALPNAEAAYLSCQTLYGECRRK